MSPSAVLRLALVLVAGVVVQISILSNLTVDGMHPELIWLFPVAAALVAGAEVGAITGFAAGIALDCLQPTPFGLTALVATLIGYGVGLASERSGLSAESGAWWLMPALGAGMSALAVALYGLLGFVFGEDQFTAVNYLVLIPVVTVAGGLFAIPVWLAVHWSFGEQRGRRRISGEVTGW
jgi:rod shape-determining protein MreD